MLDGHEGAEERTYTEKDLKAQQNATYVRCDQENIFKWTIMCCFFSY